MANESLKLDVALIHYPVNNKQGEVIGSAVTNLDVHDISRAGRTFGVDSFYVVTPFTDQKRIVQEIADHWLTGYGASRNPDRKEALSILEISESFAEIYQKSTEKWGRAPIVLATCAKDCGDLVTYSEISRKLVAGEPYLLLFGTAWGLAAELLEHVDAVLPPIVGPGGYNHLSVRSAVSIVLDRLLGS